MSSTQDKFGPEQILDELGAIINPATEEKQQEIIDALTSVFSVTPSSPTFATVGISSGQILASNLNRKGVILTNTSVNIIYLGIGATAVVGSGITLYPGGSLILNKDGIVTGAINAIASAASSNVSIQEFV